MALIENGGAMSLTASADLSAHLNKFVSLNASGEVVVTGLGGSAIGVLSSKPTSQGSVCAVRPLDGKKNKVVAGGVIPKGSPIASDANGKAKVATATSVSGATVVGSNVLGYAVEASAADGNVIQFVGTYRGIVPTTLA